MVPFICKNSGMKFCKECKLEKTFTDYIKQGAYWHPKCNECRLKYAREYHLKRKERKNVWNQPNGK